MAQPPHQQPAQDRVPDDAAADRAAQLLAALHLDGDDVGATPYLAGGPNQSVLSVGSGAPLQAGADEQHGHHVPLTSLLDFTVPLETTNGSAGHFLQTSAATRDSNDQSHGSRGGIRANLQESATSVEGECNLIVAGLTREIDDDGLRALFAPFGNVLSSTVMRHVGTGVSRGYGFVLFSRQHEGEAAIAALHGSRCGPNTLNVHRSHHDGTVVETNAVFVRNLPLDVTNDRVASFFRTVSAPVSIEITDDTGRDAGDAPNGRRYRVATVAFDDIDTARRVVKALHNKPFPPTNLADEAPLVIVKFAESSEFRRRRHRQRPPRQSPPTTNTTTVSQSSLPASLTNYPQVGMFNQQLHGHAQQAPPGHHGRTPPVVHWLNGVGTPLATFPPGPQAGGSGIRANTGNPHGSGPPPPPSAGPQLVYLQGPQGQLVPVLLQPQQQIMQPQQYQPQQHQQQQQFMMMPQGGPANSGFGSGSNPPMFASQSATPVHVGSGMPHTGSAHFNSNARNPAGALYPTHAPPTAADSTSSGHTMMLHHSTGSAPSVFAHGGARPQQPTPGRS